MTKDEWVEAYDELRLHLMNDRGFNPREAWERARVLTEKRLGPCPGEFKLPLKVRLALWWGGKKLEEKMDGKKSKIPKWILALAFGLAASYSTFELAMADGGISAPEWVAIANAVLVAGLGKFSNPEKKLSHLPSTK